MQYSPRKPRYCEKPIRPYLVAFYIKFELVFVLYFETETLFLPRVCEMTRPVPLLNIMFARMDNFKFRRLE